MSTGKAVVGIIMGSQSDWPTLKKAAEILDELQVPFETRIVSAHRTPERLYDYAKSAKAPRPEGDHRRRRRGGAPARHDRVVDTAAGAGRAHRHHLAGRPGQPLFDRADAGRACRWGRWPSARPAPPTPVSWRRKSSPSPIRSCCSASRRIARRAPPRSPKSPRMREHAADAGSEARLHHRHSGRRTARPHAGGCRLPARLQVPHL